MANAVTIQKLLEIEPRIKDIIPRVRHERNWDFAYIKAKQLGYGIVGWGAEIEEIRSEAAYHTFISYICCELNKIYHQKSKIKPAMKR